MALVNPPGLYSEGNVRLNPLPYVNIALQARARKDARDAAIDQYYQKLPDTLNDKGLRDQEVPIVNEYKQKIFDYGQQNKEALKNPKLDNGAAQHGLSQLFREASGVVRNSQNAAKKDLEVGKMVLSKDGNWVADDEDFIEANRRHSLPVTDPDYKEYDMVQLMSNKPYDLNSHVKELKNNFKYGEDVTRVKDPNDPLYDVVISSPKLDEKTKQSLYAYSVEKLHNSKKFQKVLGSLEPDQLTMLNRLSEKTFGHPIREDFADEDLAAAYNVSILPVNAPTKEKSQINTGAVMDKRREEGMADWLRKNKITFGQSMQKIAANKAAGQPPEDLGYLSDNVADESGEDLKVKLNGKESTRRVIFVDKVDPDRLNIIIGKDPSQKKQGVKAVPIKVPNADGSYTVKMGYYQDPVTGDWEGLDGQKISRERVKDAYINKYAPSKFKAGAGTKAAEEKKYELD